MSATTSFMNVRLHLELTVMIGHAKMKPEQTLIAHYQNLLFNHQPVLDRGHEIKLSMHRTPKAISEVK